ncbi:hypothetical protein OKW21_003593 [Catalinimonas alkaloidigena]|nr:hypothetical protein [Catalinimonas alkaloidigena]
MKTPYENRFKFGLDNYIFGKSKKKARPFYWLLFIIYLLLAISLQFILGA